MKTPTAPTPNENTLHPNTPSCGYEYSMPPNLTSTSNCNQGDESPELSSSSPNRQSPFTCTTTTTSSSSSLGLGGGGLSTGGSGSTGTGGGSGGRPGGVAVPPFLPLTTTTATGTVLYSGDFPFTSLFVCFPRVPSELGNSISGNHEVPFTSISAVIQS